MVTKIDRKEAFAALERSSVSLASSLLITGGCVFLLSLGVARRMMTPIVDLASTARRVESESDFSLRAPLMVAGDEIGELNQSFNKMLKAIGDRECKLREREDRLRAANEELRRSNAELEQFAYVASHDLKSPLRAIDNLASWIDEDSGELLTNESKADLELLRSRVRRMDCLLDALLEYSRIGRQEDESRSISVAEIVDQCIALHVPPGDFSVTATTRLPEMVAPPGALLRVFGNLISNAIKHHDRRDGRIEISWRKLDDTHEFTVRDDGPGIDPRFHDRVFELFQTLKRRDEVEGSGMGLALVKKTVEAMGGRIRIESAVRSGTAFTFSWPETTTPASGHVDI